MIDRLAAAHFGELGKVDHTAEFSIFGQIYKQMKAKSEASGWNAFKVNETDKQIYEVGFIGENSIDWGGPYRETLINMCSEMEKGTVPLLVKTPNNRLDHGDCRECFTLDSLSKNPTHQGMYHFLGLLIGTAFRSTSNIPFNLPPLFWKQLNNEELEFDDLKSFDTYEWQKV